MFGYQGEHKELLQCVAEQLARLKIAGGDIVNEIALFTYRIQKLTQHVKENHKDLFTKRSLVNLVGKRRRLLDYLKANDIEKYRELIKQLGIRK